MGVVLRLVDMARGCEVMWYGFESGGRLRDVKVDGAGF